MDEDKVSELVDEMTLVFGLLTARLNDDIDGFYSLLGGDDESGKSDPEKTTRAFLGMTDFALSCLRFQSEMTGLKVSTLLQTLSMVSNIAVPDLIRKRERER